MTDSHILVQEFEYREPASVEEAVALLSEYGERAQVLAGGTYLLVQMKMERIAPECVVYIGRLPGLDGVAARDDGGLSLGALTSIRALRDAPPVRAGYTALAEACAAFGSTQIQVMGTLGGNICNGSPASDTVPALLAFDAQLTLVGPDGERTLPLEEFLLGPGRTALRRGELLTAITLPSLTHHASRITPASAFLKISRVAADLAKASVAAVLWRDGDTVMDSRLAYGAVGPTALRARRAEATLTGRPFSAELALEAGRAAAEEISPIDDVRSTAWYRREVVKVLTHDAVVAAWERAGETRRGGEGETGEQGDKGNYTSRITHHASRTTHHEIDLTVNGVPHRLLVRSNELLLNVLRERLHLTGAKYGCGVGECGACTVLLNGKPTLACLTLALTAAGGEVTTVEGLEGADGRLDPLQEAFIEHAAFQCGYCTPGVLMMSKSLLEENPSPTEDEVRDYLKGNRCRCTGFASIVRAVMSCAR